MAKTPWRTLIPSTAALLIPMLANAATLATLYSFGGSDGSYPNASPLDVGGQLYGTTINGGAASSGTVYKLDPSTGVETVVHSFTGGSDGASPYGGLLRVGSTLFGTTYGGGAFGLGTIFKVDPETGAEKVLYSFAGGNDGRTPLAALINVGGVLYSTTVYGGASGLGTVFNYDMKTRKESVVHTFGGSDGAYPYFGALLNVGGILYGTTEKGGVSGFGTVFSVDTTSGTETVLHSFTGSDGAYPIGALIDVGGVLYGTAFYGGPKNKGVVFGIDSGSGAINVLHTFRGKDGATPESALIKFGSHLYGTTVNGGASGLGTVFDVNITTGAEKVVHSFVSGEGNYPVAGLIAVGGIIYGATTGYDGGSGTVFELTR